MPSIVLVDNLCTFFREYTKPNKDPSKTDKITRIYNNYSACKCCIHKNNCFTDKQTHRTITENGERMQRVMHHKMEKEEYKEEFSKKPYVEDHLEYSKNNST